VRGRVDRLRRRSSDRARRRRRRSRRGHWRLGRGRLRIRRTRPCGRRSGGRRGGAVGALTNGVRARGCRRPRRLWIGGCRRSGRPRNLDRRSSRSRSRSRVALRRLGRRLGPVDWWSCVGRRRNSVRIRRDRGRRRRLRRGRRRIGRRSDRSRRRSRRRCEHPRRQEQERVDVAVRVGGDTHAHVDVRDRCLRPAPGSRSDRLALAHGRATRDADRADSDERDGIPVLRADAEGETAAGYRARERHRPADRREHGHARRRADVDAAVLPAGICVRLVVGEAAQHGTVGRPYPRRRGGDGDEQHEHERGRKQEPTQQESRHENAPLLSTLRTKRPR
jgi:hypothetical protein